MENKISKDATQLPVESTAFLIVNWEKSVFSPEFLNSKSEFDKLAIAVDKPNNDGSSRPSYFLPTVTCKMFGSFSQTQWAAVRIHWESRITAPHLYCSLCCSKACGGETHTHRNIEKTSNEQIWRTNGFWWKYALQNEAFFQSMVSWMKCKIYGTFPMDNTF